MKIFFPFNRLKLMSTLGMVTLFAMPFHAVKADNPSIAKHQTISADSFTPKQQKEIIAIIRQALKDDPTILEEAVISVQNSRELKKQEEGTKRLNEQKEFLQQLQSTDGSMGNPNAKNVVVEFYDPRCPYCKKALSDLTTLVKEYNNVHVILKVVPILGETSYLQAQAITAATRQNGYVRMMNGLMKSNEEVSSMDAIKAIAKEQGLDADLLEKDMKASSITNALKSNVELLRSLAIDGTPAFVVNGSKIIPGAISHDNMVKQFQLDKK